MIYVFGGCFKVRIGDELYMFECGGFVYLLVGLLYVFLNLIGEFVEIIVVYMFGGGYCFYEEFGFVIWIVVFDRVEIVAIFECYGMMFFGFLFSVD